MSFSCGTVHIPAVVSLKSTAVYPTFLYLLTRVFVVEFFLHFCRLSNAFCSCKITLVGCVSSIMKQDRHPIFISMRRFNSLVPNIFNILYFGMGHVIDYM
jgi:hypothetical protein